MQADLTLHFSRIKAANVTSLNLPGTIMTYCLSFSGTAKFSWSIQLDGLLASLSACNAGLRLFWFSSAMEILMGSFKLISASRVTPKPQKMKNTWGPTWGAAGGGGDTFTYRTANAIPVKNKEFVSHASNTERTLPQTTDFSGLGQA